MHLCAPSAPDAVYVLLASTSADTGVPEGCGGVFPLDLDPLLLASLSQPAVFQQFVGVLDGSGRTDEPAIAVPDKSGLAGLELQLAFATLDPAAPCGLGPISAARRAVVLP